MIKQLFPIFGVALVSIFASASLTGGLLENEQTRGHALDGIRTAVGLPYGSQGPAKSIYFQSASLHTSPIALSSVQSTRFQAVPSIAAPPAPPQPPATPNSHADIAGHTHGLDGTASEQRECF